jgi:ADP-heptose:LPS heptosyltransferase
LKRKEIPEEVLVKLETQLADQNIQTSRAYFKKAAKGISYRNFTELMQLISDADYIISSDSLPAHAAQLLQKPHAILYANKINQEWVTPFAKEYGTAFTFDQISNNYFKIKGTPTAACG